TLPLVLHFIDALTFYHQHQREEKADAKTGEVYLETDPQDIRWAFDLLKEVLFRKSDELSGAARTFYQWLQTSELSQEGFYATTIREHLKIHPRTLSRHLRELTEHGYLRITGGNKHTTGYSYAMAKQGDQTPLTDSISQQLDTVMKKIEATHIKRSSKRTTPKANTRKPRPGSSAIGTPNRAKANS
ncbi:MAG: helix-turn-helix domain-containing protein, partial [Verrucomicrobiota bacterium]